MDSNCVDLKRGNTKFVDEFSKEVYEQTYKYGDVDKDINDTHLRVAMDLASVEKDPEFWTQKFIELQEDFKFVPGGRITSNAGTDLRGTTYINCFVDGAMGSDQDSMEGILSTLRRQALILKSEGGYGFCADFMRPRGGFIFGIGNETPGSVRMLDMWDTQSAVITEGSGKKTKNKKGKIKIRKGAQMVTMSCWHPDIEEYITAKLTSGKLTKFNMSVLITDDLMKAVKNNSEWNLEFPDYEISDEIKEIYKKEWDGNLKKWKEKKYPVKIYKTFSNANELWDLIMMSTYNRNEPGVLFVDTMNKMNNLYYCEYISATNPCGEQILPVGGVCLLGSINLTQFIDFENKNWDYIKLKNIIPIAVRFMDNVNDKTNVPLEHQKENLINKRRIGLGIMGYGSALMMLKMRYGSEEALNITEKLMSFISNTAYQASALIAKEKGVFKLYDREKYLAGNFVKNLSVETIELIKKYGLRNSHLLSIQPTGNSSVCANNVSGGLEPVFLPEYIRTSIQPYAPNGLFKPKNINWTEKKYEIDGNTKWSWKKEGDESVMWTEFNGNIWKFDKSRGLLKETIVKDYAVRFLEENDSWDNKSEYAATTTELGIDEHIKTMAIMAKYIDSAMSKTVNLPNNFPYVDFKKLYEGLYNTGTIKGGTTYRAGTMTTVLSEKKDDKIEDQDKIIKTTAPKRPKSIVCDLHQIMVGGENWIVLVGLLGGDPYEVFAFKKKNISIPSKIKHGKLIKIKSNKYDLEIDDFVLEDIKLLFESNEQEALTRMISTALRHGTDIQFIYDQLQKSEGHIVSFSKAIGRTLKKYIKEYNGKKSCETCLSNNVSLQEGCFICLDCGSSKCN
jgi:ribonucleoside-diphosphate reductase alpha chain